MDKKFKVVFIGSSSFKNPPVLFQHLDSKADKIEYIISGGSSEFDELVTEWCKKRGIPQLFFYPRHHNPDGTVDRGARFKNLHRMFAAADFAVFYHDGESKGTADAISICQNAKIQFKIIEFTNDQTQI
jgi:hypothetical protein